VDQLNNRNFLLYHPTAFHVCNLVNDELVIREYREFDIYTLECPKLCGNELFGLRHLERRNNAGAELMQYCKIDLVTLKEEVVEFPLLLNNQPPILIYFVSDEFIFLIFINFRKVTTAGLEINYILFMGIFGMKLVK
jgi:hypothetical protein